MTRSWNWLLSAEEWGPPMKHCHYVTDAEPLKARHVLPRRNPSLQKLGNEPQLSQLGTSRTWAGVRPP